MLRVALRELLAQSIAFLVLIVVTMTLGNYLDDFAPNVGFAALLGISIAAAGLMCMFAALRLLRGWLNLPSLWAELDK